MTIIEQPPLKWYNYVVSFFAGAFLANTVPHNVQGISRNPFPPSFGDPPGKGSSSRICNVLWGDFNLLLGFVPLHANKKAGGNHLAWILLHTGIVAQGIKLSRAFSIKYKTSSNE